MGSQNYEDELRESQRLILQALYPEDYVKLKSAAQKLGIEFERARQARQYGKGSTITINGLIFMGLGIHPKEIRKYLPKFRSEIKRPAEASVLEQLMEQARSYYSENELMAWLRLLLARGEIESELGLRKNPTLKSKK